jgi:TolB-like protein/class 3 adenylate cyclase
MQSRGQRIVDGPEVRCLIDFRYWDLPPTGEKRIMERRLVAILAADVVGYSGLMERDEAGTLAALKSLREDLFDPKIAAHHGRIVKLMGDGTLVDFSSVVDAVVCAVDIQRAMAARNAEAPAEERIDLRIGVNLGDVIIEGDDIYGDGVNIAARLESLAEPGGVCVSRTVFNHVRHKADIGFENLGEHQVKNISEPVVVYRALVDAEGGEEPRAAPKRQVGWRKSVFAGAAAALVVIAGLLIWQRPWAPGVEPASLARMAHPLPDKPSIAVLPFTNMSDDPNQEYFTDGMTEDLITDLAKISGLFVIARNSVFTYKGKAVEVRQVAEDLGVRYVLEGSVRRAGEQVRINTQLIDATTGGHLWADRYDGSLGDIFALQDKVTRPRSDGDRQPRRLRRLPEGLGPLSAPETGRLRHGDRPFRNRHRPGSKLRPSLCGPGRHLLAKLETILACRGRDARLARCPFPSRGTSRKSHGEPDPTGAPGRRRRILAQPAARGGHFRGRAGRCSRPQRRRQLHRLGQRPQPGRPT